METEKNFEKVAATVMLKQRERNWSLLFAISNSKNRFIVYFLLMTSAYILSLVSDDSLQLWLSLICGIAIGSFLRDIGWLIRIKKSWAFTEKITDWNTVKEIAEKN